MVKENIVSIQPQKQIEIDQMQTEKNYPSITIKSELFSNTFNWKPTIKISDSISEMVNNSMK